MIPYIVCMVASLTATPANDAVSHQSAAHRSHSVTTVARPAQHAAESIGFRPYDLSTIPESSVAKAEIEFDTRPVHQVARSAEVLFRGQSPPPAYGSSEPFPMSVPGAQYGSPQYGSPQYGDPVYGQPAPGSVAYPDGTIYGDSGTWSAFSPGGGVPNDPFLAPPGAYPTYGPPSGGHFGVNGTQPFRYGWKPRVESGILGPGSTKFGGFSVFELDTDFEYTAPAGPGSIFTFTPEFDMRSWSGPTRTLNVMGGTAVNLPGNVYRFGVDLEWESPANEPVSWQVGFNPSVNSDLNRGASSQAWNWDGRAALFLRSNPFWTWMFGLQYWDRVNDYILPYGGLVYADEVWEVRMTFPEARISYFVGPEFGCAKWMYVRSEYHVESYEVSNTIANPPPFVRRDQIEIQDWRILIGGRMHTGTYSWFIEGGWVFGRDAEFRGATPSFGIGTAFIGRMGVHF